MLEKIADGRTDLVFDYLAAGHAANSSDPHGVSLIKWCAYYGDVSAIKFLLDNGEFLSALGDNLDLNAACFHGHWQLCQYLIEHGADVNHPLPDTAETPLHATLCHANRPAYNLVLKVLLAHGADPNCKTLESAETSGFMRDCRTRAETPLHRAAAFGNEETIQLLLDAGAVIDAKDMNGDSPLTWASWHLRPAAILQKLCYGPFRIHPSQVLNITGDHGTGSGGMEANLRGKPHVRKTPSSLPKPLFRKTSRSTSVYSSFVNRHFKSSVFICVHLWLNSLFKSLCLLLRLRRVSGSLL